MWVNAGKNHRLYEVPVDPRLPGWWRQVSPFCAVRSISTTGKDGRIVAGRGLSAKILPLRLLGSEPGATSACIHRLSEGFESLSRSERLTPKMKSKASTLNPSKTPKTLQTKLLNSYVSLSLFLRLQHTQHPKTLHEPLITLNSPDNLPGG